MKDPEHLAQGMRSYGSYRLSRAAQAAKAQADARPRAEGKAARRETGEEARARGEARGRERTRKEAEEQARAEADKRARMAALERYRTAPADASCRAGTVRWRGGLLRTAVFNPAAQEPEWSALALLLLPMEMLSADICFIPGDVATLSAPGFRVEHGGKAADAISRYRGWQEEERAETALAALLDLLSDFERRVPETEVPPDELRPDLDDVRLALIWSDEKHHRVLAEWYRSGDASRGAWRTGAGGRSTAARAGDAGRDDPVAEARKEMERLLSARLAEKAVRWFYARSFPGGDQARDVAAGQLAEFEGWLRGERRRTGGHPGHSHDYSSHDIALPAGESPPRLLDVKNCRHSGTSRGEHWRRREVAPAERPRWWARSYRKHCVPRFKQDRWGNHVRIAGVFSPYSGLLKLLQGACSVDERSGDEPVVVLGETDRESVEQLQSRYPEGSGLEVSFEPSRWNPSSERRFLPPWVFSLPPECYPPAEAEPGVVERHFHVASRRWETLDARYWPLFLKVAELQTAPGWIAALAEPWKGLVQRLVQRPHADRTSLPDLYLGVLDHFLAVVRAGGEGLATFDPGEYRTFLFGEGSRLMPLGIHDPLGTVDDLVGSLVLLMEGDARRVACFTRFRFGHAGVLQASADGVKWVTLMFPYCGGEECGYERLALGKDGVDNCGDCGHLVCPRPGCRFCGRGCPGQEERRSRDRGAAG